MKKILYILLIIFLSSCTTQKFPMPDIKDDYCGVHINFQYCKCAFHKEYCDSIGMTKSEANTYVKSEYNSWVDEQLKNWLAACLIAGGIPGKDDCTHKTGVIEKDGNLYLNSKPGEVLSLKSEDIPLWARDKIATVGAMISVVGHPDSIVEGDNNVLIDGRAVARLGDGTLQGGVIVESSSNIFVNGKPVAIIGNFAVNPMVAPGPVPAVGGPIVKN